ncbi:MAG TPA: amidohydrolase family protein, partial [Acidimicrobiales bacterium]|nr:amidohydrolase family protein [Acidimicrobiales bacterium]
MKVLIAGGTVVGERSTARADVLVEEGRVLDVAPSISAPAGAHVIDAQGAWVGPGFVDLHAHLREPGGEAAETIESGARAAAVGGYSAVVAMPNTDPALDNPALVAHV